MEGVNSPSVVEVSQLSLRRFVFHNAGFIHVHCSLESNSYLSFPGVALKCDS